MRSEIFLLQLSRVEVVILFAVALNVPLANDSTF